MPRGGKGTIEAVTTPAYHAVCMCGQVVNGVMTFTACNFFELNGFGWELGVGLNFAVFQVSQAGRQAGWLASACTTDYHGMAWSARALLCDMTTDSCVDVPHRPSVCVLQGTLVMNFCNFFETNVATAMISVGEAFYVGGAYPPPPHQSCVWSTSHTCCLGCHRCRRRGRVHGHGLRRVVGRAAHGRHRPIHRRRR